MNFFHNDTPVRSEQFEDYEDVEDPDEVLSKAELNFVGEPNPFFDKKEEEEDDAIGLKGAEMPEEPPEPIADAVDNERWKSAKELSDEPKHDYWRRYKYGRPEDWDKVDDPTDIPKVPEANAKYRKEENGEGQLSAEEVAERTNGLSADDVRERWNWRGKVFDELKGIKHEALQRWGKQGAPTSSYEMGSDEALLKQIDNFDPKGSGASISTFAWKPLVTYGEGIKEQTHKKADLKALSGNRAKYVAPIRNAIEEHERKHGEKPDDEFLADKLQIPKKTVRKTRSEIKEEHDMTDEVIENTSPGEVGDKRREAVRMVYSSVDDDQEKELLELLFPDTLDGKELDEDPQTGFWGNVADEMGIEQYQLNRIRDPLIDRIDKLQGVL